MTQEANRATPKFHKYPSLAFTDPLSANGTVRGRDAMDDAAAVVAFIREAMTQDWETAPGDRERTGLAVILRAVENSVSQAGEMIHMLESGLRESQRSCVMAYKQGWDDGRAALQPEREEAGETYPKIGATEEEGDGEGGEHERTGTHG